MRRFQRPLYAQVVLALLCLPALALSDQPSSTAAKVDDYVRLQLERQHIECLGFAQY